MTDEQTIQVLMQQQEINCKLVNAIDMMREAVLDNNARHAVEIADEVLSHGRKRF